jgi:aerobic-type carbon monoxide dehydrogenase small subunit (CoxS/CutS family)
MKISFYLNGEAVSAEVPGNTLLLDLVRGLGLTGTKEGCGVGVCGACTVLVDDRPVSSCLYLAACVEGGRVETVEGLARSDHALTEAFVNHEGMQCGICTPGQVVAAAALKRDSPHADHEEVVRFMSGNLCRCTGYQSILAAVEAYLVS